MASSWAHGALARRRADGSTRPLLPCLAGLSILPSPFPVGIGARGDFNRSCSAQSSHEPDKDTRHATDHFSRIHRAGRLSGAGGLLPDGVRRCHRGKDGAGRHLGRVGDDGDGDLAAGTGDRPQRRAAGRFAQHRAGGCTGELRVQSGPDRSARLPPPRRLGLYPAESGPHSVRQFQCHAAGVGGLQHAGGASGVLAAPGSCRPLDAPDHSVLWRGRLHRLSI